MTILGSINIIMGEVWNDNWYEGKYSIHLIAQIYQILIWFDIKCNSNLSLRCNSNCPQ